MIDMPVPPNPIDWAIVGPEATRSIAGRRVGAAVADLVPLGVVFFALSDRETGDGRTGLRLSGVWFVLAVVVTLGYYFVAEATTSTTPGKRLFGLRVVDSFGERPTMTAVAKRTAMRCIDALPVLYLVGFIAMVASPTRQRLGDMVASTRVVATGLLPEPTRPIRRVRDNVLVVLIAIVTVGIGVAAGIARSNESPSADRVGTLTYDVDVVPFVDRIMNEVFGDRSVAALMDVFAPGAATDEAAAGSLTQIESGLGAWHGDYSIVGRTRAPDHIYPEISADSLEVLEVKIRTEFDNGPVRILLALADIGGEPRLLAWNAVPVR